MTTGTKSVLFGAHCFFIHPWFVLWAYWKLYGFTLDPRIIVACIVHDWGYAGKSEMDSEDGETHPILGARIMGWLFDWGWEYSSIPLEVNWNLKIPHGWRYSTGCDPGGYVKGRVSIRRESARWYEFTLLHSRYYAKRLGKPFSRLCVADKLAICLTPWWLYIPLVKLTGEIDEYMHNGRTAKLDPSKSNYEAVKKLKQGAIAGDVKLWYSGLQEYMAIWVAENKDGDGYDLTAVRT